MLTKDGEKEKGRGEEIVETFEGKTRLLVPAVSLIGKVPPKVPAFFNPSAKLNRDISIIAYRAFMQDLKKNRKSLADSFSGIGARALRVAVESPEIEEVHMNDINTLAIDLSKKAAKLNFVTEKCNFSVNEVCNFLTARPTKKNVGERFGIVDLDPFGSPSQYIDCVLRAVFDRGLISITATDTAVLCGVYRDVCFRRYYGRPINNHYANETAIRLLTSLIALTASRLELAIHPLFAHANLHYLRVYIEVSLSSSQANKVYDNIGYLRHCFRCGNRNVIMEYDKSEVCELCGNRFSLGGKLWISRLFDKNFIKKMSSYYYHNDDDDDLKSTNTNSSNTNNDNKENSDYNNNNNNKNDIIKKILALCLNEIDDIPYYFRADEISSKLKTSPRPLQNIIEKLSIAGYRASKTSLNTSAFKTDARIDQILSILR
jgi:tRNA (guanine26-N2/guanine27-N2)-dimethyltransferase